MKPASTTPPPRLSSSGKPALGVLARIFGRKNRHPRKVLIIGGIKSGKSFQAEVLAESLEERYENVLRITAESRENEPAASELPSLLRKATEPVLIDCLGVWLNRLLVELGTWQNRAGWQSHLDDCLEDLVQAWSEATVPVLAVSNETGSGMTPPTEAGRLFRDVLGALNLRISLNSDRVLFMIAGRAVTLT